MGFFNKLKVLQTKIEESVDQLQSKLEEYSESSNDSGSSKKGGIDYLYSDEYQRMMDKIVDKSGPLLSYEERFGHEYVPDDEDSDVGFDDGEVYSAGIEKKRTVIRNADEQVKFSPRIEALIKSAFHDGVITQKEKEVILRRAVAEGEDRDEFEMLLDSRIVEMGIKEEETAHTSNELREGSRKVENVFEYLHKQWDEVLGKNFVDKFEDNAGLFKNPRVIEQKVIAFVNRLVENGDYDLFDGDDFAVRLTKLAKDDLQGDQITIINLLGEYICNYLMNREEEESFL